MGFMAARTLSLQFQVEFAHTTVRRTLAESLYGTWPARTGPCAGQAKNEAYLYVCQHQPTPVARDRAGVRRDRLRNLAAGCHLPGLLHLPNPRREPCHVLWPVVQRSRRHWCQQRSRIVQAGGCMTCSGMNAPG